MSELNFKNFPSLSKGVATSANENLTTAEKNQLNKYLQEISETAGKLSECHTIMGFMRETGQLANSYSIQSQMTALASSFGEKKKKILAMLGSDKVSSTSEEQIKKHPSIAKLRSFFDKNIALQTKPSSQNKEAVSQMKKNFDDSFYKRLDSISAMLPTQTRELFLSYMKEYMTTIGSSNKSESEKLELPENYYHGLYLPEKFALPDSILVFFSRWGVSEEQYHGRYQLVIPFAPVIYCVEKFRYELQPGMGLLLAPWQKHNHLPGSENIL